MKKRSGPSSPKAVRVSSIEPSKYSKVAKMIVRMTGQRVTRRKQKKAENHVALVLRPHICSISSSFSDTWTDGCLTLALKVLLIVPLT